MAAVSDRVPGWLREELVSFVLFAVWLTYLTAAAIVLVMAADGRFSDREQAMLVVGFGLLAPLVGWVVRAHVERVAGPQPGRLWQLDRQVAAAIRWPARRRARLQEVALAMGSVGLFWTVWTGSLLAALVVPVAVWTLILVRSPPRRG